MDNNFAVTLNKLRKARHLTTRELAVGAGVPQSLISGLQTGNRVIGEYAARKIGKALHLHGDELEDFIYSAINTCSEKVLDTFKDYPAEILNLVANELRIFGISADAIRQCIRHPSIDDVNAALYLNNGKEAFIKLEVAYA